MQAAAIVVVAALVGATSALVFHQRFMESDGTTIVQQYGPNAGPVDVAPADLQGILFAVEPSVVTIDVWKAPVGDGDADDLFNQATEEMGTGMIVSADGRILTNHHVIDRAVTITVTMDGSTTPLPATVIRDNASEDVALLQVPDMHDLPTVTLANSADVKVGDPVVAIGNALGLGGDPTVTTGIISAVDRNITLSTADGRFDVRSGLLQTDAALNLGNSGGPLVDSSGHVVGMNSIMATTVDNGAAQNISFAIPSNRLRTLLTTLAPQPTTLR